MIILPPERCDQEKPISGRMRKLKTKTFD